MVKDKVAIITGSARGIGFEIGKIFAENGAKVVLSDLDQNTVEKAALGLKEQRLGGYRLKSRRNK